MNEPTPTPTGTRSVYDAPAAQVEWLIEQAPDWVRDGLISEEQASALTGRYAPVKTFALARILLWLGAGFFSVGVIWLVASNLDQFSPLVRLGIVSAFWIGLLVAAEWLASRREHSASIPSPVVGAARILATAGFGATIAQASQSLQVPAFEPALLGYFAAGALVYAYAVRATGPLALGVIAGFGWFVATLLDPIGKPGDVIATLLAAGLGTIGFAALHRGRWSGFAPPWRELGWVCVLITLFVAALPMLEHDGYDYPWFGLVVVAASLALGGAALARGDRIDRADVLVAGAALVLGVVLAAWDPPTDLDNPSLSTWGHAALAVAAYILTAGWVAVSGTVRDSWRLVGIGLIATVIFTTFQSFAVFALVIQGAWLFLVLGAIFLATGYFFDRARRSVAGQLEDDLRGAS